jgi:succinoglycan biosynthesis protein ExoL
LKVAYFVHDLHDAAVARRIAMMQAGGLEPVVLGFRRSPLAPTDIGGAMVVDLGRTADARLGQRAAAVLRNWLFASRIGKAVEDCSIYMARNLESLILAARVAGGRRNVRLVYECLDIHRTLLGTRAVDRLIQKIERSHLQRVDLLVTSSPAFLTHYFTRRPPPSEPALLVENKVLRIAGAAVRPELRRDAGPPWTIGWFGMLRCRRSLDMLAALARLGGGRVKVLIAGKPALSEIPDFERVVRETDGLDYAGPYKSEDLPALYRRTHFTWAIDYFEEGLNSSWLLPNRLYEGSFHGSVPIALDHVETGAWLRRRDAGILVRDPVIELAALLATLDEAAYARERARLDHIPLPDLVTRREDCDALAAALAGRGA